MARRKAKTHQAGVKSGAVLYLRVSTKEQCSNNSLPVQEDACARYCEEHGLTVERVFREEGFTATTLDRPQLAQLLDYCKRNHESINRVVVYDISRLSREAEDTHALFRRFRDMGITVSLVMQPVSDSPEGRLMRSIYAAFAQFDNDLRREKCMTGMRRTLENGGWPFKASLGYRKIQLKGKGASLDVDPTAGPVISKCFQMIDEGYALADVATYAAGAGLVGRESKRALTGKDLGQLLRREVYCGIIDVDGWGHYGFGQFIPLVSHDLWKRVQRKLDRCFKPPVEEVAETGTTYPLRRFVRCKCDQPITASATKNRYGTSYPYYHCHKCGATRIKKADLEERFIDLLNSQAFKDVELDELQTAVRTRYQEREGARAAERRQLTAKLSSMKQTKSRLIELLVRDVLSESDYRQQSADIDRSISEVEATIANHQAGQERDMTDLVSLAKAVLLDPGGFWVEATLPFKVRFQSVLFPGGLKLEDGADFSNLGTFCVFSGLRQLATSGEKLVGPPGFEPGTGRL